MTPLKNIINCIRHFKKSVAIFLQQKLGRDSVTIAEVIYFPDLNSWIIPVRTPVGKVDSIRIDFHFRQNEKKMLPFLDFFEKKSISYIINIHSYPVVYDVYVFSTPYWTVEAVLRGQPPCIWPNRPQWPRWRLRTRLQRRWTPLRTPLKNKGNPSSFRAECWHFRIRWPIAFSVVL